MSTETKKPLSNIYNEFNQFIDSHQSVVMATINKAAEPEASYAPVMRHDGRFYVYISELSNHTFNLMEDPQASLLFIEPENDAKHLFARKRATLKATANTFNARPPSGKARWINWKRNSVRSSKCLSRWKISTCLN